MTLDKQAVLERIENDLELYRDICEIFRDEGPELMRKLRESVDSGEITLAIRSAHSLKSSAANIGANELSELARQAEEAGNGEDTGKLRELLPRIGAQLNDVIDELSRL